MIWLSQTSGFVSIYLQARPLFRTPLTEQKILIPDFIHFYIVISHICHDTIQYQRLEETHPPHDILI